MTNGKNGLRDIQINGNITLNIGTHLLTLMIQTTGKGMRVNTDGVAKRTTILKKSKRNMTSLKKNDPLHPIPVMVYGSSLEMVAMALGRRHLHR